MRADDVISVLASTLYTVIHKKVSVRKAFSMTCKTVTCSSAKVSREDLFQLTRKFVSSYYMIKGIAEKSGKSKPSNKTLARLFLYLDGESFELCGVSKLYKTIKRDFPHLEDIMKKPLEPWTKFSYPKWLYEELVELLPIKEVEELLEAMNKRVYWLRINTLKVDVDKALRKLEEEGVVYEVDSENSFLVRILKSRKPLRTLELFKEGLIITQDKASVLVVRALKPEPGMLIYDFAAAPGVKASLIMQLTENKAKIVAVDYSLKRLSAMKGLLKHYGVDTSRVIFILSDSRELKLEKSADIALVDAPCSSSGAISKDPAVKILLAGKDLVYNMKNLQIEMLSNALKHVDKIVYSTCSILPEEGEEVVQYIMRKGFDHKLKDTGLNIPKGYKKYEIWDKVSRTLPHKNMCEGFFIARFEK